MDREAKENSMDRRLAGYSPWVHRESETIEQLTLLLVLENHSIIPLGQS